MSCHALAITSWISSGLAIGVQISSFVSSSRFICCKTLIWGLISFCIHSKSSDDPALRDSWSFTTFVLPPVPSVFLVHLVRQHDHLFVNFCRGFSSSHLTQLFLHPAEVQRQAVRTVRCVSLLWPNCGHKSAMAEWRSCRDKSTCANLSDAGVSPTSSGWMKGEMCTGHRFRN